MIFHFLISPTKHDTLKKWFSPILVLNIFLCCFLPMSSFPVNALITNSDSTLAFSTYFGGSSYDYNYAVAVDDSHNIYVTGKTSSANFPTRNAYNSNYGGSEDAYVLKFDSTGLLTFSTFFGGTASEQSNDIAIDHFGNIYITGTTYSSDFPIKNAYNNTYGGSADVFIAKFDPTGNLLFSSYLGGSNYDLGDSLALDDFGNCYITGNTQSTNFPLKNNMGSSFRGNSDIFVAKFSPSGDLLFSTLLGGSLIEFGYDITVNSLNNIFITGRTMSDDFPMKNAFNATYPGNNAVFITSFNSSGSIMYSTYFGGSGADAGESIHIDSNNNYYITGYTLSKNFPTKNAFNATNNGNYDVFCTKFNQSNQLIFSTYFGGSNDDTGMGITTDSDNSIIISGYSASPDFPVLQAFDSSYAGNNDAFVTKLDPSGSLLYSSFFGGSGQDIGYGLAIDDTDSVYISGYTRSFDLPVYNGYYVNTSGQSDLFLAKFGSPLSPFSTDSTNSASPSVTTITQISTVTKDTNVIASNNSSTSLFDSSLISNPVFIVITVFLLLSMLLNIIVMRKK